MSQYKGVQKNDVGDFLLPVPANMTPVEETDHSSQAYSVGEYFTFENSLYKATRAIAVNDEFEIGVNCELVPNLSSDLTALKNAFDTYTAGLFNRIYPVGSIYMSVRNVNPGSMFGGTWVAWGSGRVPVGVDTSDTNFNTVEKTVGANTSSYTPAGTNSGGAVQGHAITVDEMPSHTHSMLHPGSVQNTTNYAGLTDAVDASYAFTKVTHESGGNQAHSHGFTPPTFKGTAANISNIQKSITCYMWKRTA